MATTRATFEAELVSRAEAWLTAASMAVTFAGSNADLNSPLGWAIRQAGGTVAGATVADGDVATVDSADLDLMYDLAELRMLQSILANYAKVDKKAGPVELKSSQLFDQIRARIASLREWLSSTYSYGGYAAFSVSLTRTDGYSELADDDDL
jgi:hypothetical protein